MLVRLLVGIAVLALVVLGVLYALGTGMGQESQHAGEAEARAVSPAVVAARGARVGQSARAIGVAQPKQILFGDLHVHTTFSFDAFMLSLPTAQGEGAHPPADACDFARFCSALDFWSINDHAEQLTTEHWRETIGAIRQCNAVAGDPANPDTVAFLGWEWTNVGATPADHFGHKNVVLAHTDPDRVPARPIAAGNVVRIAQRAAPNPFGLGAVALAANEPRVHALARYFAELADLPLCAPDTPVRELPADCLEYADTPADLYRKLDDWGHDAMVIPHGTTWGFYTPTGSSWDKQLVGDMHDPERSRLLEIFSGHGDSEVYRSWRAVEVDAAGNASCPEPTPDYLPSCWQAGEIIRERCAAAGEPADECERRAVEARANAAAAGGQGHLTVPGATAREWLDAGQCRDCDQPAFNYRPGGAAQYILALGNFDEDPRSPRRFRFGFMASSDNHFARPGTGYKERFRRGFTESNAQRGTGPMANVLRAPEVDPVPYSVPFDRERTDLVAFQLFETERQTSFFMTGGLVAAHADGRDRGAIWDSLSRREVYGTSGPRILLWFDLLNPPDGGANRPMGSEVAMRASPIFQVRAVGSFEQEPGCPEYAELALGPRRLEHLCRGECYHPSDRRRPITRIEVVRIRPQTRPDEDVASLIDDPWLSFDCGSSPGGCVRTFSDPEFARDGRESVYYVRAYEPPTPGINVGNLRCERDAEGNCIATDPCPGPEGAADECLADHEPRAWSSPIFVDPAGS